MVVVLLASNLDFTLAGPGTDGDAAKAGGGRRQSGHHLRLGARPHRDRGCRRPCALPDARKVTGQRVGKEFPQPSEGKTAAPSDPQLRDRLSAAGRTGTGGSYRLQALLSSGRRGGACGEASEGLGSSSKSRDMSFAVSLALLLVFSVLPIVGATACNVHHRRTAIMAMNLVHMSPSPTSLVCLMYFVNSQTTWPSLASASCVVLRASSEIHDPTFTFLSDPS